MAAGGGACGGVSSSVVDGCGVDTTNDISMVEMLHREPAPPAPRQQTRGTSSTSRRRQRRGSGKCIWPTTEWLRKLRANSRTLSRTGASAEQLQQQDHQQQQQQQQQQRRSSVLLMVLLHSSSNDEMKAKAVLVSEEQQQRERQRQNLPQDEVEDAIDALWL
ncbi:Hypothetical predicted protein [Drosophila guanche]|uniref:Uncharacterized protein n=3 Tax=Drosophila guanche TaxID=7266 RepID=A0A3B0JZZ3_DROGU|nr:Hypothetical predicted protein [Drosophila guanche]